MSTKSDQLNNEKTGAYEVTDADFDADFALVKAQGITPLVDVAGAKFSSKLMPTNTAGNFKEGKIRSNLSNTKNSF